jgi:release factor glutamine methyltransferase
MTVTDCLKSAALGLTEVSDSPRLDAQLLLSLVLNKPREWLLAYGELQILDQQLVDYQQLLEQRQKGVPIAYLIGCKEFFGLKLAVNRNVLIPRPETECLVDWILSQYSGSHKRVLDLGTGSGAIILSLAVNRLQWECDAVDISVAALQLAEKNALSHQVERIRFSKSNWFESIGLAKYDIIVANPPYIAAEDKHLDDLQYEPSLALVAANDGFCAIELILSGATRFLAQEGVLVLEHGYQQQDAVMSLARQVGYADVSGHTDLSGLPRYIVAKMV